MKKLLLLIFTLGATTSVVGETLKGRLEKTDSIDGNRDLTYQCTLNQSKITITFNSSTNFLDANLLNDIQIRGFASETIDKKTGTNYYFLQGGSEPFAQRLTLAMGDNGKFVRFTQAYGADDFVCE